ncbi:sensor histidine kinase [Paenibacillus nanensis]|uniref:histidine kinase n=1 Tax=Paenibacillus nanensis TaxID=393251 RepID=A0A3A1UUD8_9BACL|nr:sensor histidine kinase [Paenibacillus nanensis]RIX50792.1 sensor histidine kinase [Paenibacillus nanensis]
MSMLIGRFANRSIRFKLLFYFIIIILFSILAISLLGSTLYKNAIEEETNAYTAQTMEQVKNHIDVYIQEMDNIIYYLSSDEAVQQFLREADNGLTSTIRVREQQALYMEKHKEIAGIFVVSGNNQFVGRGLEPITRDPMAEERWYKLAYGEPDQLHLISHPIGRNIRAEENISADQVLSFVRAVKNPDTGGVLGVILIDMRLDIIQKLIQSATLGKSGFVFIMDGDGGVVYSPVNKVVYRISGDWLNRSSGKTVRTIDHTEYQLLYHSFPDYNWRIVGVFPLNEPLQVVKDIQLYTLLIAFVTLSLGFAASWYFTSSIVKPVGKLRSLMKKVEEGELHLRYPVKSKDEIGELGNSFNNMVQEIDNLIHLVYLEQKEKREAELKILQAQIKPHFLYNTLDTIQWMAQDRDADDIVDIVVALTSLFRISLSKGRELIPLREEIQHVESYLIIQMARYEDKLSYEIHLPEELAAANVPKIILQPLVENAIYHGIKAKAGSGHIRIGGCRDGQRLILTVEDDGVGFDPVRLNQMNEALQQERRSGEDRGYGIYNVNERIRLSYGSGYGLQIESARGHGTRIEVQLPLLNG